MQENHEDTWAVCDGEGAYDGHPRVFLDTSKSDVTVCPYCSKHFSAAKAKEH
jgi:uncharacterized Zn-finger protein